MRNLLLLSALFAGLYLVMPDMMGGVYQTLYSIFGPLLFVLLLIYPLLHALRRRR